MGLAPTPVGKRMKVLRKGGKFTRSKIKRFANRTVLAGFLAASVFVSAWFLKQPLLLLAVAFILAYGRGADKQWDNWWKGKAGEEAVIKSLEELSDDYLLVNDLMLSGRGGNVDHFLAGPSGLFVLETKNWSGRIKCIGDDWFCNGRKRRSMSKQAKSNARRARNCLPGNHFVVPVLVFADPRVHLELRNPTVPAVKIKELAEFIRNYRPRQSISQTAAREIIHSLLSFHAGSALEMVDGKIVELNT